MSSDGGRDEEGGRGSLALPDAVAVIDDNERVTRINPAMESLLGVDAARVENRRLAELAADGTITPTAVDRYREAMASLDDGETVRLETELTPDAGQSEADRSPNELDDTGANEVPDDVEPSDEPTLNHTRAAGDTSGVRVEAHIARRDETGVVSLRDVTARRRTEAALEALHETAQAFTSATSPTEIAEIAVVSGKRVLGLEVNGIYLYDQPRDVLEPTAATDRARTLLGELPTFTGGESYAWRTFQTGTGRVITDLAAAPGRYREETPLRCEMLFPLGEFGVYLVGSAETTGFADWQVAVARVLAADTTRALERAAREAELRARREELERQNDRLDAFASVVSHDLRNPLNVAAGNLELARVDGDTDRLDKVGEALNRAEQIVDDVLTMAREGETVEKTRPVDLAALAGDCWATIAVGDAELRVADPPTVLGDRRRVRHVLENLFANAVEHNTGVRPASVSQTTTDDDRPDDTDHSTGGETDPDTVAVTVELGGMDDGFYVADDGQGIPPEERDQIFEPGHTSGEDGTGLGLTIVQEMVTAHDWNVRATASAAGGARFEITGVELADDPTTSNGTHHG